MAESKSKYSDLQTNDFAKWFWDGSNGNELVKYLNCYARQSGLSDLIRREKNPPVVYAIVVNNFPFPKGVDLKLVNVGLTQKDAKPDSNNRMEKLEKDIESAIKKKEKKARASTLFAFPVASVDTTSLHQTGDRIRKKFGYPVKQEKADSLKLLVPTKWVLTTQDRIERIVRLKEQFYESESFDDVIDIFKDLSLEPSFELPDQYKHWV